MRHGQTAAVQLLMFMHTRVCNCVHTSYDGYNMYVYVHAGRTSNEKEVKKVVSETLKIQFDNLCQVRQGTAPLLPGSAMVFAQLNTVCVMLSFVSNRQLHRLLIC